MPYNIVPLREEHLEDAASLFVSRYRAARAYASPLPARHEDPAALLPKLRELAGRGPGTAALRDGRLCGYLLGQVISFRGQRSIYTPVWGSGAVAGDGPDVYRELYTTLSARWVANGCFTHVITHLAHDRSVIDAWHWLSFGLTVVDAVRDLSPVSPPRAVETTQAAVPPRAEIRRAGPEDAATAAQLADDLNRHLAAPPTFLAYTERESVQEHGEWLANPERALWLAEVEGRAVGYIRLEPSNPTAAYVVHDPAMVSITGAFVRGDARRCGVGAALLGRAIEWARKAGYAACAVDFESHNVLGARFWTRHFRPVCYSLIRHVDPRLAWAHAARDAADMW
jgi:GNAT superfamily N-acetyltransferase